MGIDFVRSRALSRVAEKYPSEALEADALHFSTDVWSTFVVILGISGAWLGMRFGFAWLGRLDAVAALAVAGVIIWIGSRLGRRTRGRAAGCGARTDCANASKPPWARRKACCSTERVRVRRAGQRYFVDVTHQRSAHGEPGAGPRGERSGGRNDRADRSRGRGGAHGAARASSDENIFEAIRAIAQRRGMSVHELSAHQFDHRLFIELHLEVDEDASLREAHRRATELEQDILKETDPRALVNIHIEPLGSEDRRRRGNERTRAHGAKFPEFAAIGVSRADELPRGARAQRGSQNPSLLPLRDGRQFADH